MISFQSLAGFPNVSVHFPVRDSALRSGGVVGGLGDVPYSPFTDFLFPLDFSSYEVVFMDKVYRDEYLALCWAEWDLEYAGG